MRKCCTCLSTRNEKYCYSYAGKVLDGSLLYTAPLLCQHLYCWSLFWHCISTIVPFCFQQNAAENNDTNDSDDNADSDDEVADVIDVGDDDEVADDDEK